MELNTHLAHFGSMFPPLPQQPFFPFSLYYKTSNFKKEIGHQNLFSTRKLKKSTKKTKNNQEYQEHRQTCITPRHNLSTLAKNMKKNSYTLEDTRDITTSSTLVKNTHKKNFKLLQTFEKFKKCTFTTNTSPTKYQLI